MFSSSPRLIAAYYVFHRLLAPRYPPCALSSLTINTFILCSALLQLSQYAIVKEIPPDIADDRWVITLHDPSAIPMLSGGGERDRTDDLLVANQALSQLSYTPDSHPDPEPTRARSMVGLGRFELPTSRLSGVRSNQLSYRPLDYLTNR